MSDQTGQSTPIISFHRFVPAARFPQRADRSAAGSLPTRAFRFCEAVVTAAAYGYYVFPPTNFSLMWDGHDVSWTWEGADGWYPLKSSQFPNFREQFDEVAPDDIKGFSPPFVSTLQEPGLLQLWSGLVVRTAAGWSTHLRAPANLPRTGMYELYEGIIETDRWFGPLFGVVRLARTNVPISFSTESPLFQVQPLPREAYQESTLNNYEIVPELRQLRPEDWDDYYQTVVRPNVQEHRPRGQYATRTRKRRKADDPATAE